MTALEQAKAMIGGMTTNELLNVWECTTNIDDPNIPILRGWLMDEFEKRHPEAFAAWLDTEECKDGDLRKYLARRAV